MQIRAAAPVVEAITGCVDGRGSVCIVEGPCGTGKTEVLRLAAHRAAEVGAVVLRATGSHSESGLALGIVEQLVGAAPLDPTGGGRAGALLEGGMPAAKAGQELCRVLLSLAARQPMVICVDDVQHADAASLQCLSYLARRTAGVRLSLLLTELVVARHPNPLFRAEILGLQNGRQFRLRPLSERDTTVVIGRRLGMGRARRLASRFQALSGGSPLLLGALVEDYRAAETPFDIDAAAGETYAQAILTCLYRTDAATRTVAGALAVLGASASPRLAAELLGTDVSSVSGCADVLSEAGLLDAGRWRHERARLAALQTLTADDQAALHRRAAAILYDEGADPAVVAGHVAQGGRTPPPWAVPVLRDASVQALGDGDYEAASRFVRLAERAAGDPERPIAITAELAAAAWRVDPSLVVRHLDDLMAAARGGRLDPERSGALLGYLLWHGRIGEADELAAALTGTAPGGSTWLELVELTGGAGLAALVSLVLADRPGEAEAWCESQLRQAADRRARTWEAAFGALRGLLCLRRGEPAEAERRARTALKLLPAKGWGVYLGVPLATLVMTCAGTDRLDEARALLDRPVPEAMFETPFGLLYLQASGHFHEAAGDRQAAVGAFRACGEIMARWGMDPSSAMLGHSPLAQTHLRLLRETETAAPEVAREPTDAGAVLSEAELRVAALAAVGHTNRQIAEKLFITMSTVEQHLTRIYRKLRVNRREQLSRALAPLSCSA
jgi:DNA-binding CsgD family transcriptional regulator